MKKSRVISISFGLGGHVEMYAKEGDITSHLSGYDTPESWQPQEDSIYKDGTPVWNAREFFRTETGIDFAIKGPMLASETAATNANWPLSFQKLAPVDYLPYLKAADVDGLVKYGHIKDRAIVWD